jgi:hypothetical protein
VDAGGPGRRRALARPLLPLLPDLQRRRGHRVLEFPSWSRPWPAWGTYRRRWELELSLPSSDWIEEQITKKIWLLICFPAAPAGLLDLLRRREQETAGC